MKPTLTRLVPVLFATLLLAAFAHADENAYGQILKKRDAVLAEILSSREARYATGVCAEEDVMSARLALLSFRRDTATSVPEKIRQQELIVGAREKRLASVEARSKAGTSSREDLLLATDAVLQARQALEELRAKKD